MARGESAGLQIALIIFVILTIVLGATTTLFFYQMTDFKEQSVAAREEQNKLNTALAEFQTEREDLLKIIGVANAQASAPEVVKLFRDDMQKYATGVEEAQWNYHGVLQTLSDSLMASQTEVQGLQVKFEEVTAKHKGREEVMNAKIATAEADLQKALQAQTEQAQTTQKRITDLQQQHEAQLANVNQSITQLQAAVAEKDQEIGKITNQLNQEKGQVATLSDRVQTFNGVKPSVVDGSITWVDQRNLVCWIDLGSADGLQAQQTFSVYPNNTLQVDNSTPTKGSIEITRVIRDHLAEAKLIDFSVRDPIIAGDKIYTPVWKPGQRIHFALAGLLDYDGDGQPDNDVVRRMIQLAGGEIDAEVTGSGDLVGEIKDTTNYLVVGAVNRTEAVAGTSAEKIATATQDLEKEARRNGVRIITLDEFQDMTGFRANTSLFKPGRGEDFKLPENKDNGFLRGMNRGRGDGATTGVQPQGNSAY